jgi:hypothetical protein
MLTPREVETIDEFGGLMSALPRLVRYSCPTIDPAGLNFLLPLPSATMVHIISHPICSLLLMKC